MYAEDVHRWNEEEISNLHREHHAMEQKTIKYLCRESSYQLGIAPHDLQQLTQATVFENHPDEVEAWVE